LQWRDWEAHLVNHPDRPLAHYVVQGIRDGFRIGFDYAGHKTKKADDNMYSATEHPQVVQEYLLRECREHRVVGPLNPAVLPQAQISRFGVIPKKNGQWRLIVDLSSPHPDSVNDGINRDWCSTSYVKVEDAAREIFQMGRGAKLAKVDIKSAYRIVPVHPDDRPLLGMMWDGNLFVDCVLPFGLRSAPRIFSAIADVLEWRAKFEGIPIIFHYLDDFLIISPPSSDEGSRHLHSLLELFERLRVPVAPEKVEGPASCITFLGIEFDTNLMILRLPQQKLQALKSMIAEWLERLLSAKKPSCSVKDLQSLVGSLQHACKVVRPGRTFLRRMFDLLKGSKKKQRGVRLNKCFLSDLMWWHLFLEEWNGIGMVRNPAEGTPDFNLHTDASGSYGCGAWIGNQWLQLQWPHGVEDWSIAAKELVPIVLAALIWGGQWCNKLILVHCDNQAVVEVINSGSSKEATLMHLLRAVFFISAHHGFAIRATHIPGERNTAADAISRNNPALFFSQVPAAQPHPSFIPQSAVDLVILQRPDWLSPDWSRLFKSCLLQGQQPQPRKCMPQEQIAT